MIPEFDSAKFTAALSQLIQERMSIADLCRASNINRQQFNKYLNGENTPSISVLYRIAATLGVSLDQLCGQISTIPHASRRMDETFEEQSRTDTRQVVPGFYLEIARYGFDAKFVVSATKMEALKTGGTYFRKTFATRFDGTKVPQEFWGRYFEGAGRISIHYANVTVSNVLGVLYLRRLDQYGNELVGVKLAHVFEGMPQPVAGPVGLKYLGENTSFEELQKLTGVLADSELPASLKPFADMIENSAEYKDGRLKI